jgi:hypothetical protein
LDEPETRTNTGMTLCLFVGPCHLMAAVNEAWRARYKEPTFGIPTREAWTDPVWRPLQVLMDSVYETGEVAMLPWAEGICVIAPVTVRGQRGVGVAHVPAQPQTPGSDPRSTDRTETWALTG